MATNFQSVSGAERKDKNHRMAIIRYERSIASVSWIDAATHLAEVDPSPPGPRVSRSFLTGSSGYRFVNYLEVWANYDTVSGAITGLGFAPASGLYQSSSFAGLPCAAGSAIRNVLVSDGPITFTQLLGARTESPDPIGCAHTNTHFPPIWTELELKLYNDGRLEGNVVRQSLFPSMSFYISENEPVAAPDALLNRAPIPGGAQFYNAVPHLDRWQRAGWGPIRGRTPGPSAGNPWEMEQSIFSGSDPTQPFGW
jgi:hypothetical protein